MSALHTDAVNALVYGDHGAPFDILGPHPQDDKRTIIRALNLAAKNLAVIDKATGTSHDMTRLHQQGLFEAEVPFTDYQLAADDGLPYDDPYAFKPILTDYDRYLLGEGRHLESYDRLGAHMRKIDGVTGVHFAVWAPNAQKVSVIGDFNQWDTRSHPMRLHEGIGIWELFIPGLDYGTIYKYEIRSRFNMFRAEKTDPYGFQFEVRPKTASIVADIDSYQWHDNAWMEARIAQDYFKQPISIYEVHLGSWRHDADGRYLTYRQLADHLVQYVKEMGYTHLELMPIAEHPFDGSWGYQVTGYFAPTSRFGTPQDFMYFVDTCHQHNIGVILDWVPAHFPKDGFALSYFDGTHLYEHSDSRRGEHPDWGTYIFNFGRNEVRNFLISNAIFWLKKYHIDGLRVDAVSSMIYLDFGREEGQWLPNEHGGNENIEALQFLQEFNTVVHTECPGTITVAEESTSWSLVSRPTYVGGLGFTFKWNMGWMHDSLYYLKRDPVHRRYHHHMMTFSLMYAYSENFVLSLSHDEVVHLKGSMMEKAPGDWWQKFANLRAYYGYQMTHPGKKLVFMGGEFGQWREWDENRSLDWFLLDEFETHNQLQSWVRDLNHFYQQEPALYELDYDPKGFRWIDADDADQSVYSYIRYDSNGNFVVVALNFTPVPREGYRIGVPHLGYYAELMNSDSSIYGGSNIGNEGGVQSKDQPWHGLDYSLSLTLPPLGFLLLKKQD